MRIRRHFAWLAGLAAFALVACSSNDDPAPVDPIDDSGEVDAGSDDASLGEDGSSDDDDSDAGAGGSGGDSGDEGTGGSGGEAGNDDTSDAGSDAADDEEASDADTDAEVEEEEDSGPELIGSDPGRRWCGDQGACGLNQACCFKDGAHACKSPAPPPKGWDCQGGNIFLCDESADCTESSPLCCVGRPSPGYATQCHSSCEAADKVQLCRTHEECENGEACTPQVCNGMTIQACGTLPAEFCP